MISVRRMRMKRRLRGQPPSVSDSAALGGVGVRDMRGQYIEASGAGRWARKDLADRFVTVLSRYRRHAHGSRAPRAQSRASSVESRVIAPEVPQVSEAGRRG